MLRSTNRLLAQSPPSLVVSLCLLLVGLIGFIDYQTGYELSVDVLYIAPVAAAAWYLGRRSAVAIAAASATSWLLTDWGAGHRFSHPFVLVWDGAIKLTVFAVVAYLVSALRDHMRIEHRLARSDWLTSLGNSRAFSETAWVVLELARRHGHVTAFGFIDLDNFKQVNDDLGHTAGDRVLVAVAETLRQSVRSSDFVVRLGGDEFAVLLPQTTREGAERVFTTIRNRIAEQAKAHDWPITCSLGVAVFRIPPSSPDVALHIADGLMYQIKNDGKDGLLIEEIPPADPPSGGETPADYSKVYVAQGQ
jgi:diguanylate cyclase (GGDEF)-like protein